MEEKFKPFGNQAVVLGLCALSFVSTSDPESKSLVELMLQSSRTQVHRRFSLLIIW